MSIAANLPPRAKRLSLRIADIGIPIPPRVKAFLDGPEVEALDGARAWGIEDLDGDTKLKVRWASGRLHDLLDLALSHDPQAATRYLPVATIGTGTHMFAIDVTDPALAVYVFEAEAGFKKWADDFDSFAAKLLRRGEKDPTEKLEATSELAKARLEAKDYAGTIELLTPVVARFPKSLTDGDDGRDELGTAYNLLGLAWQHREDIAKATACFETSLALGCEEAGLHLCELLLETHKDYDQLVRFGERCRERSWRGRDTHVWFHLRNYLGRAYLLTKRRPDALRAYHQISTLAVEHPEQVAEAIADLKQLRAERAQADRDTLDEILGWLEVPALAIPPARLAALRAWWPALPTAVSDAIREQLALEGEPSDADLIRISRLDELAVTEAGLTDASWVTQLEQLDDLDLSENDLADLTPIAELRSLTRLDVSDNKLTSLRPLAALTRLKRVDAGNNPLTGLEGLERLHELEELDVTEAGLESIEPLRGLRGLVEVTLYENRIADLSPLAECPRLKEISSFTNPITSGLAALGTLPWLESIDAGDESTLEDVRALRAANPTVAIDHWYPDDDAHGVEVVHAVDPTLREWWNALPKVWKKAFVDTELHTGTKEPDDDELHGLVRQDSITIDNKPLLDLAPMSRFARADYLCFETAAISNLSPLAQLPRLRDLIVRDNKLDLVTLAPAEKLEELYLERCSLSSLIGLERCRALRKLQAEDNHVDDLRPLADLAELRVINLEGNRVSDLAPLAKLTKLHTLSLGLTRITDLAPLAKMKKLEKLSIKRTNVTDVSPLKGLEKLKFLYVEGCAIGNLDSIQPLVTRGLHVVTK